MPVDRVSVRAVRRARSRRCRTHGLHGGLHDRRYAPRRLARLAASRHRRPRRPHRDLRLKTSRFGRALRSTPLRAPLDRAGRTCAGSPALAPPAQERLLLGDEAVPGDRTRAELGRGEALNREAGEQRFCRSRAARRSAPGARHGSAGTEHTVKLGERPSLVGDRVDDWSASTASNDSSGNAAPARPSRVDFGVADVDRDAVDPVAPRTRSSGRSGETWSRRSGGTRSSGRAPQLEREQPVPLVRPAAGAVEAG